MTLPTPCFYDGMSKINKTSCGDLVDLLKMRQYSPEDSPAQHCHRCPYNVLIRIQFIGEMVPIL